MPVGTPFHDRTLALSASLNFRDWAGYYAAGAYESHHEHEYTAIRNGAALIDVSPLYKYAIAGRDAAAFVDRLITRDARRLAVGQVIYTPWCDERGLTIDDGTVARLGEDRFRWTAAEPNLRWFRLNATGLDVTIDDVSEALAAVAVQGPTSARVLTDAGADVASLKYFQTTPATIGGVAVDVSRTGYTGDLGYEVWVPREGAHAVWDALVAAGAPHGLRPTGLLALDVARIEAGLLLIDVDFVGARRAQTTSAQYTPLEMGLDRLVDFNKERFIGRAALVEQARRGVPRKIVGLEVGWRGVERLYEAVGLPPLAVATASRVAVPVRASGRQVGRMTSSTWSPVLKKMIGLATVDTAVSAPGSRVEVEHTVEGVRHFVAATVVDTPFFNPRRKVAIA